jgi:hypothetical protein
MIYADFFESILLFVSILLLKSGAPAPRNQKFASANENMVENLGASAPDFKKIEKRHLDVSKKVEIITSRRPMGQAIA